MTDKKNNSVTPNVFFMMADKKRHCMFYFMTAEKKQVLPLMFFSWRPIKNDSVTPYVFFMTPDKKNNSVTPNVFFHDSW